jgi:hypothetical protein
MTITAGNDIFLALPGETAKGKLHPGKVIEADEGKCIIELEEPLIPEVGAQVNLFLTVRGKFMQQAAAVAQVLESIPKPRVAMNCVGDMVSAEKRQVFRVSVTSLGMLCRIVNERRCPVVDMSVEGFAAIASKQHPVGLIVPTEIYYQDQTICTPARIQTVYKRPDGKFRYGLRPIDKKGVAKKFLRETSSAVQRMQLRRQAGAA